MKPSPSPKTLMPALPSPALEEWRRELNEVVRLAGTRRDGFCACDVCSAIKLAPANQQAQLVSGLFWSVWIDQVVYWLLVDPQTGNQRDPARSEPAFYEKFRAAYLFPKIHAHGGCGMASPFILLSPEHARSLGIAPPRLPSVELLKEDKREFWDEEVARWLELSGRQDVKIAAERAFQDDVRARFPEEWQFLAGWFLPFKGAAIP